MTFDPLRQYILANYGDPNPFVDYEGWKQAVKAGRGGKVPNVKIYVTVAEKFRGRTKGEGRLVRVVGEAGGGRREAEDG